MIEKCVSALISLYWDSESDFAKKAGISHTAVNNALKKFPKHGKVKDAFEKALNITIK